MPPKTLYEKIWDSHVVHEEAGKPALIYIDRHLIHEGTSPQAFAGLKRRGAQGAPARSDVCGDGPLRAAPRKTAIAAHRRYRRAAAI